MDLQDIGVLGKTLVFEKLLQARALFYTLESTPLPIINRLVTGHKAPPPTRDQQVALIREAQKLLSSDADNFAKGIYPASLLTNSWSEKHLLELSEVYLDSFWAARRRKNKQVKQFPKQLSGDIEKYPDYYRRNFHHQSDGYLSEASARRYELQVELLFRGMADPMRRSLLCPMKEKKNCQTILELGCGTGQFTKMLAKTFPKARIVAVDLSPYYISYAKKRCRKLTNVDFMVGNAESLPFKDGSFDAVVSVFLLHELPKDVRQKVIDESFRLSKKLGFCGFVDSLQLGDIEEFDEFLLNFPVHFHEPFYKDYIQRPLVSHFKKNIPVLQENHFLSKMVCRKNIEVVSE